MKRRSAFNHRAKEKAPDNVHSDRAGAHKVNSRKKKKEKEKKKKKRVTHSIRLVPQCPLTKLRSCVKRMVLLLIEFI